MNLALDIKYSYDKIFKPPRLCLSKFGQYLKLTYNNGIYL